MIETDAIKEQFKKQFPDLNEPIIEEVENLLCINDWVPMPVLCSKYYDREKIINLVDHEDNNIGELHFIQNISFEITGLPIKYYYCFVAENQNAGIVDSKYIFKYDYILIHKKYIQVYKNNQKKSSPIWGGYFI